MKSFFHRAMTYRISLAHAESAAMTWTKYSPSTMRGTVVSQRRAVLRQKRSKLALLLFQGGSRVTGQWSMSGYSVSDPHLGGRTTDHR